MDNATAVIIILIGATLLIDYVLAMILFIIALRSPIGYEDKRGYHDGERPRRE